MAIVRSEMEVRIRGMSVGMGRNGWVQEMVRR